jgi:hypothetical protein
MSNYKCDDNSEELKEDFLKYIYSLISTDSNTNFYNHFIKSYDKSLLNNNIIYQSYNNLMSRNITRFKNRDFPSK